MLSLSERSAAIYQISFHMFNPIQASHSTHSSINAENALFSFAKDATVVMIEIISNTLCDTWRSNGNPACKISSPIACVTNACRLTKLELNVETVQQPSAGPASGKRIVKSNGKRNISESIVMIEISWSSFRSFGRY